MVVCSKRETGEESSWLRVLYRLHLLFLRRGTGRNLDLLRRLVRNDFSLLDKPMPLLIVFLLSSVTYHRHRERIRLVNGLQWDPEIGLPPLHENVLIPLHQTIPLLHANELPLHHEIKPPLLHNPRERPRLRHLRKSRCRSKISRCGRRSRGKRRRRR